MAFGVVSFDELNKLVGMNRSEPFDEYFAPMKISDEQKKERIRLAERLEDEFIYMLSYMFYAYPEINTDMANELRDRYLTALIDLGIMDATQRHRDDPYYYSEDRARLCAEDQANFVYDIKDFSDALENGYAFKTWNTVGDNRVRDSHEEVEGLTIPIEEPFSLQGGLMMQPHDASLGVDESELIMCRCSLSYSMSEV